jgi:hypothetical protein
VLNCWCSSRNGHKFAEKNLEMQIGGGERIRQRGLRVFVVSVLKVNCWNIAIALFDFGRKLGPILGERNCC